MFKIKNLYFILFFFGIFPIFCEEMSLNDLSSQDDEEVVLNNAELNDENSEEDDEDDVRSEMDLFDELDQRKGKVSELDDTELDDTDEEEEEE